MSLLFALSVNNTHIYSKYVKLSRETHEVIQNAVVPGSFFVDVFPARTCFARMLGPVLEQTLT